MEEERAKGNILEGVTIIGIEEFYNKEGINKEYSNLLDKIASLKKILANAP